MLGLMPAGSDVGIELSTELLMLATSKIFMRGNFFCKDGKDCCSVELAGFVSRS
jgi:hypothetical protein